MKQKQTSKAKVLDMSSIRVMVSFVILTGLVMIMPFFPFQGLTGPIVNAILLIAVVILGTKYALILSVLPSITALGSGLLAPVMFPIIPFIVISNMIFVLIFESKYKDDYWLAVGLASLAKFVFVFGASQLVARLFIAYHITQEILVAFSWPQFLTALAGGFLAFVFLKIIKRI